MFHRGWGVSEVVASRLLHWGMAAAISNIDRFRTMQGGGGGHCPGGIGSCITRDQDRDRRAGMGPCGVSGGRRFAQHDNKHPYEGAMLLTVDSASMSESKLGADWPSRTPSEANHALVSQDWGKRVGMYVSMISIRTVVCEPLIPFLNTPGHLSFNFALLLRPLLGLNCQWISPHRLCNL